MRNRVVRLALMLAILGVVVIGATSAVRAQSTLPVLVSCGNSWRYDLNHDGVVNGADMDQWVRLVHESGDRCQLGKPLGSCPSEVDVDGDGIITHFDLDAIHSYWEFCVLPRSYIIPGR